MKRFTLEYWEDEGWYVGRLVEIPGIFSQGETLEELKENIQDAYGIMLKTEPVNIIPASAHRVPLELHS
jgi:predicted RNase H-like HicB family nuclease